MAHGDFKDLTRGTASDKRLHDMAFNIGKNAKYDGCQRGIASMVYKCFDKIASAMHANKFGGGTVKNEIISNKYKHELLENLRKQSSARFLYIIFGVQILLIRN